MRWPWELVRTLYSCVALARAAQRDRASAVRTARRDLRAILDDLPRGDTTNDIETPPAPPIFLLSAGWRSGSTLLQRLVCSDPSVLVWGEPYDRCHITENLMASLRPFGLDWPHSTFFIDAKAKDVDLSQQWIANLYPPPESMRRAHLNLFLTLFSEPAKARGYLRWGLKEVRYGREQIHYLRWLFPGAKFVLLVRNPQDCWRSYRGKGWFARWPNKPVRTPRCFGRNWTQLAGDFLRESESDDVYLVRYEDLGNKDALNALSRHLDINISDQAISNRIRGGAEAAAPPCGLVKTLEAAIIRSEAAGVASRFGYTF